MAGVGARYAVFVLCLFGAGYGLALQPSTVPGILATAVALLLGAIGLWDIVQRHHSILRNYPIIGHVRWLIETIRPELRQYLLENDQDASPFSRAQRSLVYRRAKGVSSEHPFGTLVNVYAAEYEFIQHSVRPVPVPDPATFRIVIGNSQCRQPYSASVFNISAMSFGALSANAIRALNVGAAAGGFYHDSGEGGISPYHRGGGGDIVWEIGSGYFGCRKPDGSFDPEKFAAQASDPQVKMIELKLSQGAKPGHGGYIARREGHSEIAAARGVEQGRDCVSPAAHSAFATPLEMLAFLRQLRDLSGGKPVGFKLCVGHPWEFMAIAKAMLESGMVPDFVVVDGAEGGTGAAPMEFSDHVGTSDARGTALRAQRLGGDGTARPDQDRGCRTAGQRVRHRCCVGARCRLGEFRAGIHVRARLHPVAELQHQPLPNRRGNAGSKQTKGACGVGQSRTRRAVSQAQRRSAC